MIAELHGEDGVLLATAEVPDGTLELIVGHGLLFHAIPDTQERAAELVALTGRRLVRLAGTDAFHPHHEA